MIAISRILCPIDFSDGSRRALRYAIATARWYEARVSVLHVRPLLSTADVIPSLAVDPARQVGMAVGDLRRLEELVQRLVEEAQPGNVPVEVVVTESDAVHREVLDQVGALNADLLVMSTHGRAGFDRLLLGSTTEKVMRKAACPVMIVPPAAGHLAAAGDVEFNRILCAVDFSDCSLGALAQALSIAEEADAKVTVLNVIEKPPELDESPRDASFDVAAVRAAAESKRLRWLRELIPAAVLPYCTVETAVWEGPAWRGILQLASERHSDLIVMGVHGRGAIDLALFGSNTHHVIRAATCPVLTVRG